MDYLEARRQPRGSAFAMSKLITNGTAWFSDEHIDFLTAHAFEVQLSFDGVPAAQDQRGQGTFGSARSTAAGVFAWSSPRSSPTT